MSENVVALRPETVTRTCRDCGGEFAVQVPDGDSWIARKVRALAAVCDECVDRSDAADAEREAQDRADRDRRRLAATGLPAVFHDLDLAVLDPGHNGAAHGAARRWADGSLRGLVLTGNVGVGKTTLAAAAMLAHLDRARVQWVSVPSLIAQAFGDDDAKAQVAATLTGRRALVLDDIDKVKPGEWVASQLFAAIDNRVTAGTGLLVTTNVAVPDLGRRFGGEFGLAIASRLADRRFCEAHEMRGSDRRLGS